MKWIFSIRTKLFALVLSAFLVLISVIYWQIGAKAESVADTVIDRSLTQSSRILDTRIDSRFTFIREMANGIASDGRALPLVYDEESLTLQDLSLEYQEVYDFDILFFLNSQGTILARSDQPDAIGVNLAGRSALFDDALDGQQSRGFIASRGRLMQTVVAPIFDNVAHDVVKGAVVLAYELSHETAQEIVALTESHIGFFVFTRNDDLVVDGVERSFMTDDVLSQEVSAYFSANDSAWRDVLEAKSDHFRKRFNVDNRLQHSVFRRINGKDGNPLGFVVAMRSATELKRPFKEIQQQLLMIGSICLVLASVFAGLMALGVSRPIIRLVDMTKQIQGGLYPGDEYKTRSRDEVGILQNALVKMSQSLREKAELEAYLAELSDEIENDISIRLDAADVARENIINYDATRVQSRAVGNNGDKTIININPSAGSPPPPATEYQVVDRRYRLQSTLGAGAMGKVYLADDLDLDEKIAVKVMKKNLFQNTDGINFKEEIRLARKITHRNIVRTFDFGSWSDVFYITMEYIQGYDLGRLIQKKGALELNIGIAICKQICSAMIAAHQLGIIHRDLKPSNMIINRQGILKIMDFGLAMQVKSVSAGLKSSPGLAEEEPKPREFLMGTPRYMAPEQFSDTSTLDARTDIYAIGVIMFTIFNGKPPFSASDFDQLALKHINEPIPEMSGNKVAIPNELRELIHKALAKTPEQRFQSVREMLEQLNNISAAV